MKAKIFLLSALAAVGMLFTACDDDDDNVNFNGQQAVITKVEAVATPAVDATETTEAVPATLTLKAQYKMEGDAACGGAGFCYSKTSKTPTMYDNAIRSTDIDGGSFFVDAEELNDGEQYYVRAYVSVYQGGTVYSETIVLNEKPEAPETPETTETPAE
ncbi:MAG: hypothetical protein NC127_01805 [Muribaculum sp.]|nr:hypothetical protein [Muribaculum sp.]